MPIHLACSLTTMNHLSIVAQSSKGKFRDVNSSRVVEQETERWEMEFVTDCYATADADEDHPSADTSVRDCKFKANIGKGSKGWVSMLWLIIVAKAHH